MALFSSTTAQFILLAGHLPTSMMTPCEARGSSLKVCSLYCLEGVFSETQTSSPTELSARCCWMRLRKRTPPPTRRKTRRSIPHSTNLAGRRGRLPAYKTRIASSSRLLPQGQPIAAPTGSDTRERYGCSSSLTTFCPR